MILRYGNALTGFPFLECLANSNSANSKGVFGLASLISLCFAEMALYQNLVLIASSSLSAKVLDHLLD